MDRLETLKKSERKAVKAFETTTSNLDKVLAERAWNADEQAELDAVSSRLDGVRKEIAREEKRAAKAAASLESRDNALGAAAGVGGAVVTNGTENLTYGPSNPDNSFYRDLWASSIGGFQGSRRAQERLERHQAEMDAISTRAARGSKESRAVNNYMVEANRFGTSGPAFRATITNGGPGLSSPGSPNDMAPFAPPLFFLPEYAAWRTYGRTYIDQLKKQPLPASGMAFYVPKITTPTAAAFQASENATVSTQDMASEYESGTLQTAINNLSVSQQYLDRVGPGLAGDEIVNRDQTAQLNRLLNIYGWTTTLQNASVGTVKYADATGSEATFNGTAVADYRQSVATASIAIQTTDGLVAYPTHLFADVNLAESILAAYDTAGRPFVVPSGVAFNPLATGNDSGAPEGYTGYNFGGLPLFKDQALNVAASADNFTGGGVTGSGSAAFDADSDNHLGVVGALDMAVVWMEGSPVLRVVPQPGAATLTVLIQQYVYCALVPVYPNALQVISSKATASSTLTTVL